MENYLLPSTKRALIKDAKAKALIKFIEDKTFFTLENVRHKNRFREKVEASQLISWLMCNYKQNWDFNKRGGIYYFSLPDIAEVIGKDHATVLHGNKTIKNYLETDKQRKDMFEQYKNECYLLLDSINEVTQS